MALFVCANVPLINNSLLGVMWYQMRTTHRHIDISICLVENSTSFVHSLVTGDKYRSLYPSLYCHCYCHQICRKIKPQ